ncbi:MAG: DUF2905 domain-containing protein [Acidobacteriota bacterium]|nr:DUF2905 domain-containing protein [Acidobacteriota bacterium]
MARLLVVIGLVMAAAGLLMLLGVPFGRLPGDLVVRKGPVTFYLPLATSIVVSIVLTLLIAWLRK